MSFTFRVGGPEAAFPKDCAQRYRFALEQHVGKNLGLYSHMDPWHSDHHFQHELTLSGWRELLQNASSETGAEKLPHLLMVDNCPGVFLPVEMEPGQMQLDGLESLHCASLPGLLQDLELVAQHLSLPWESEEVDDLARRYAEDDWLRDSDPAIQAYLQAVTAARIASERHEPLWMIKK
jgi:hypothetical protein